MISAWECGKWRLQRDSSPRRRSGTCALGGCGLSGRRGAAGAGEEWGVLRTACRASRDQRKIGVDVE